MQLPIGPSWRTTVAGIVTLVLAVVLIVLASTSKRELSAVEIGLIGALVPAGLGLLTARDNTVTSEQVGRSRCRHPHADTGEDAAHDADRGGSGGNG